MGRVMREMEEMEQMEGKRVEKSRGRKATEKMVGKEDEEKMGRKKSGFEECEGVGWKPNQRER